MQVLSVIVDDEREPIEPADEFLVIKNEAEALAYLVKRWTLQQKVSGQGLSELFLDHDLGDGQSIGSIVDWLATVAQIGHPLDVWIIYIHSANPVGANFIENQLKNHYMVCRLSMDETTKILVKH